MGWSSCQLPFLSLRPQILWRLLNRRISFSRVQGLRCRVSCADLCVRSCRLPCHHCSSCAAAAAAAVTTSTTAPAPAPPAAARAATAAATFVAAAAAGVAAAAAAADPLGTTTNPWLLLLLVFWKMMLSKTSWFGFSGFRSYEQDTFSKMSKSNMGADMQTQPGVVVSHRH